MIGETARNSLPAGVALPTSCAKAIGACALKLWRQHAWRKRLREGDVGRVIRCYLFDIVGELEVS